MLNGYTRLARGIICSRGSVNTSPWHKKQKFNYFKKFVKNACIIVKNVL